MSFSLGLKKTKSNNVKKVANNQKVFDCELPKSGETNFQIQSNNRKNEFDFELPKSRELKVPKIALSNDQKKELQDVRSRWQAEDAAAKIILDAKNKIKEEIESDKQMNNSLTCDTNMKKQLAQPNRIIKKTSSCKTTMELESPDLNISEVQTPNRSAAEALSVSMGKLQSLKSLITSHKMEIESLKADFKQEKEKIIVENQSLIDQSVALREELYKTVAKLDTSRSRADMLETEISLIKITNTGTITANVKIDNEVPSNRPTAEGISSTIGRLQSLKNFIASDKMEIENLKMKFKEQEMLLEKEKEKLMLENQSLLKESEVQRLDIFTVTEQLIASQLRNDREIALFRKNAESSTFANTQAHESDMTKMQTRLEDLLSENATCNTEIDRLNAESKKTVLKNKLLVSEIAARNVEVDRLKIEANKFAETLASLKKDWAEQDCAKQAKIEVLEVERKALLDQSLKIHSDLDDMKEQLASAQVKVDIGERNISRLQDKMVNVQSVRVFELQASLTILETEIVALKAESREHDVEKEKLVIEKDSLLDQSLRVHVELDHLKENLTSAQIKIDKGEKEISMLCSLQDEVMNILSTEQSRTEMLDLRVNELQASLTTSTIESASLKAKSREHNVEKEKLELETKSLLDQTHKLHIELDHVTEMLTSTQVKFDKREKEMSMICSLRDKMASEKSAKKDDTEVPNRVSEPIFVREALSLAMIPLHGSKIIETEINQLTDEDMLESGSLKIFVASHKIEINRLKAESKKHEMILEIEKEKLMIKNEMLEKKSRELELELDDLREKFFFQLDGVTKKLHASQLREEEISILEDKVIRVQSSTLIENGRYESRIVELKSSLVDLESKIANLKDHNLITETEMQKIMMDNQLLVDNSEILITELKELTEKLLASQIRVDPIEREISTRQDDKCSSESTIFVVSDSLTVDDIQISEPQLELDEMTKKVLMSQLKVDDLNIEILVLKDEIIKIQSSALIESQAYEMKISELQICIKNIGLESDKHSTEIERKKNEYEALDFVKDAKIVKLTMENQTLMNHSEDITKKFIDAQHKTDALEAEVFLLQEHIDSLKITTLAEIQKKIAELEMSQRVSHDIHIQKLKTEIQQNDLIYEKATEDLQVETGRSSGFQMELDQMIAKLFASKNKADNLKADIFLHENIKSPVNPLEDTELSSNRRSLTIEATKKSLSRSRLPFRKQSSNLTVRESQRSLHPIDQPSQLLKAANQFLKTDSSRKLDSQFKK